jgi:hypothetical protein
MDRFLPLQPHSQASPTAALCLSIPHVPTTARLLRCQVDAQAATAADADENVADAAGELSFGPLTRRQPPQPPGQGALFGRGHRGSWDPEPRVQVVSCCGSHVTWPKTMAVLPLGCRVMQQPLADALLALPSVSYSYPEKHGKAKIALEARHGCSTAAAAMATVTSGSSA